MAKHFVLIEPKSQRISSVTGYDFKGPKMIDNLNALLECRTITTTSLSSGGKRFTLILDDEGLINGTEFFSTIGVLGDPLAGNILMCETDGEGDLIPTNIDLDKLKEIVFFYKRENGCLFKMKD